MPGQAMLARLQKTGAAAARARETHLREENEHLRQLVKGFHRQEEYQEGRRYQTKYRSATEAPPKRRPKAKKS